MNTAAKLDLSIMMHPSGHYGLFYKPQGKDPKLVKYRHTSQTYGGAVDALFKTREMAKEALEDYAFGKIEVWA
jgi:hypothetical protein